MHKPFFRQAKTKISNKDKLVTLKVRTRSSLLIPWTGKEQIKINNV